MIGDPANYTIRRNDLSDYPECTLENRAHKVALVKTIYSETSEESNEIASENVTVTENNQVHEIYFSNAYVLQFKPSQHRNWRDSFG